MKVDLVVNSMIQQIDRNLQTQIMPLAVFRAGEILHGRVMLDASDRPQIRLDSGELLNALPSGDVQLFGGATVTLRVTGNMDGQFVMQLLDQEIGTGTPAQQQSAGAALTRLGLENTPQGKAILGAMEAMRVPMREETARQALTIMNSFPRLSVEKAVFLAANSITPTETMVNALNALVDEGATTGEALIKLADMLAWPSQEAQTAAKPAQSGNPAATPAVAQPPAQGTHAPALAQQSVEPEAPPAGWAATQETDAQTPPAISVRNGSNEAQTLPEQGTYQKTQVLPGQGNAAAPALAALTRGEAALELQSLALVALGPEAAGHYAGVSSALLQQGLAGETVRLALDGSLAGGPEFEASLGAFLVTLPEDVAEDACAFITHLADGLRHRAQTAAAAGTVQEAPQGLERVVKEIMDLFVKLDAEPAANAKSLEDSGKLIRESVQRMPAELTEAGAQNLAVAQQLGRVESHVRLLDNINQYIYWQIPMEMNGRNKTVELYVMNRGGSGKKVNPEKASILIALDTENMGRLETLISVNSKSLRLRIGVENPELVGFVDSYTADIGHAMQEIGYKLSDVRMQVTGKPVTPLTAVAEAESWQEGPARLNIVL